MKSAAAKEKTIQLPVLNVERTEEEMVDAMRDFALASVELVGVSNTYETIKFLTQTIAESPATYQKLLTPKVLNKFAEIIDKSKAGNMGMMDIFSAFAEVKEILK